MSHSKRKRKSLKFNDLERQSVFVERKFAIPTPHKVKKKFDKKRERRRRDEPTES